MSDIIVQCKTPPVANQVTAELLHGITRMMLDQPESEHRECPVEHWFGTGTYGRVMTIPAGVVVSGRRHRGSTITVILSGACRVMSNHAVIGDYAAGDIILTPPATNRIWATDQGAKIMTIHERPNNTEDLSELEEFLVEPNEVQL